MTEKQARVKSAELDVGKQAIEVKIAEIHATIVGLNEEISVWEIERAKICLAQQKVLVAYAKAEK